MSKSVVVTARIDEETGAGLDRFATEFDRSRAWIIEKAVARSVKEEIELSDFFKDLFGIADYHGSIDPDLVRTLA